MANSSVALKEQQHHNNGQPKRRRVKQVEVKQKLTDETLMASSSGDVVWLEQTLRNNFKKALTQTKEQGFSTIHLAAMNGHLDCLKVLIEKQGVPVDSESCTGWRALHLAINRKNKARSIKCVNYLLKQGADPSKPNHNGFTPVHQAAASGQINCLRLLIEAGAAIDTYDSENLFPVDYARIWGHRLCVRVLNDRQWHIDKNKESKSRQNMEEDNARMQEELDKMEVKVKACKIEKNQEAFESWLADKGLPDMLDCYEPFSAKVVDGRTSALSKAQKSPSPVLPKVNTNGGIMVNASPDVLPDELRLKYHYQYMDEFDADKKLDLIPLDNDSMTKRKQRAQDTFRAMRDNV